MVILRLRRGGRRHSPHYRIVAQEKRSKLNGAYIESVGHYHPAEPNKPLVVNADKVKEWIKQGAALSVTVNNLLVKEGILPKKAKISRVYSQKVKPVAADTGKTGEPKTAKADAPAEDVKETIEEVPAEKEDEATKVAETTVEAVE